ncbi:MAG: alpha/beta hydrolase [Candidatus Dormibacteraeota bacterium]|nr:alpha/beta hydrolase [Candidatus Dormibacteraeota bacterium]MBO0762517.1 alpha/beta hydrolase [Candidatus Dormibacteraeota bacterium]
MATFQTTDGTTLFHTEWGAGQPVVFAHSWGLNSDMWNYQVPDLVDAVCRCIVYDRRGHGRSERVGHGYDCDTLAGDLAALIEHLDLRDVTLVAHSFGAKEAVRYIANHGAERVARVVLVAPTTPYLLRTPDNPQGADRAFFEATAAALRRDVGQWCTDNAGPFFGTDTWVSSATLDWTLRMIVDTPLQVLLDTLWANVETDCREDLRRLPVPTLVLHGDADASAPLEITGRPTAALLPDGELKVYPDTGHGLYVSEHDRVNADVLAFIRSHAPAGRPA